MAPYARSIWNYNPTAATTGLSATAPLAAPSAAVPGATLGNAVTAGFATHGLTNIIPDTKEFIKDPSLMGGLNVGIDVLEMLPLVGPAAKLTGALARNAIYHGVDPIGYGVRKKILDFPQNLAKNIVKPFSRTDFRENIRENIFEKWF